MLCMSIWILSKLNYLLLVNKEAFEDDFYEINPPKSKSRWIGQSVINCFLEKAYNGDFTSQQREEVMILKLEVYTYLSLKKLDEAKFHIGSRKCLGKKFIMMPTIEQR